MKKTRIAFIISLLVVLMSIPVSAEEPTGKGWDWRLAPFYLWAINISGEQTIGPVNAPVEIKFDDVVENLEAIFTANFEGIYNNTWGFMTDLAYADIEGSQGPATVKFKMIIAEADGYYRINKNEHNLDLLLGLRYTSQDTDVEPTPVSISESWTDPIIGARWWFNFANNWALIARADVGGFGVGSDLTWQALGLIDWQPFKYVSFTAGYRALYQDFEDGSFKYDATTQGPLLGLNIKW